MARFFLLLKPLMTAARLACSCRINRKRNVMNDVTFHPARQVAHHPGAAAGAVRCDAGLYRRREQAALCLLRRRRRAVGARLFRAVGTQRAGLCAFPVRVVGIFQRHGACRRRRRPVAMVLRGIRISATMRPASPAKLTFACQIKVRRRLLRYNTACYSK